MTRSNNAPETPALVVRGLGAGYPWAPRTIDQLNFTMCCGECVALVGPNGAGKTTLLKSIAGLIPIDTGEVLVHGIDCRHREVQVGFIPQRNTMDLNFPVTAHDVVMMGLARGNSWLPWWPGMVRQRALELLELFQLGEIAHHAYGELSAGQQQRILIARALAQESDILLLDEPFSGVDVAAAAEVASALETLREQGITMLMATHDMVRAARDFERLLLLRETLVADGPPGEVLRPDLLHQAYGDSAGVLPLKDGVLHVASIREPAGLHDD
ncbi:MAG: metal ABC transporter ATP-binding protein [Anaerolineaceae bacterium]|nr:metal ABC transporter ATP-binding protein [Anaerolineaceae bacterium]